MFLALTERPVIVSHTGLQGHCDTPRNVSDETLKAVAEAGGLIGVGFWDGAICTPTVDTIAEAIIYAVDLLGAEHVALGSDFDGTVQHAAGCVRTAGADASLARQGR